MGQSSHGIYHRSNERAYTRFDDEADVDVEMWMMNKFGVVARKRLSHPKNYFILSVAGHDEQDTTKVYVLLRTTILIYLRPSRALMEPVSPLTSSVRVVMFEWLLVYTWDDKLTFHLSFAAWMARSSCQL